MIRLLTIIFLVTSCSQFKQFGLKNNQHQLRNLASDEQLRVGIYTGSFDPPHNGHKNIVEEFKKLHNLDRVIIVPDQNFEYKPNMTDSFTRDEMLRAMFKGEEWAEIPGPNELKPFGTADLWDIYEYFERKNPRNQYFGMMGTDTFEWYKDAIPKDSLERTKAISLLVNQRQGNEIELPKRLGDQEVYSVKIADQGFSSSAIRKNIAQGIKPEELPEEVWTIVKSNRLYSYIPSETLKNSCSQLLRAVLP